MTYSENLEKNLTENFHEIHACLVRQGSQKDEQIWRELCQTISQNAKRGNSYTTIKKKLKLSQYNHWLGKAHFLHYVHLLMNNIIAKQNNRYLKKQG